MRTAISKHWMKPGSFGEDLTSEEGYVESVEQPAVQPLKAEVKIPYHTPEYAPRYQLLQRESDPKDTKP